MPTRIQFANRLAVLDHVQGHEAYCRVFRLVAGKWEYWNARRVPVREWKRKAVRAWKNLEN